jgi:hypothetical protein
MTKPALPPLGGGCAGAGKERSKPLNNLPHRSAQHLPKLPVHRATAPALTACCGSNTIAKIIELTALHLRRSIPALPA